ncbi:MAG TPA: DUF1592 domain-containing protein, partial [Polyangiaceae bacterium]
MAQKRSCRAALAFVCAVSAACTGEVSPPLGPGTGMAGSLSNGGAPGAGVGGGTAVSGGTAASGAPSMPAGATGFPSAGAPSNGGSSGAPTVFSRVGLAARLSKFEYRNSVADLLGVALLPEELDAAVGGIPDDTGDGVFKHLADKQTSVEQHALAYFQIAEAAVERADVPALAARLGTCVEATAACGTALIQALGKRMFRRPLEQREVDAMLVVYDAALAEQSDFTEAARWTLLALLQTPEFLFRLESETTGMPGQPRDLNGYELAGRLSSFLWMSVPDDALLAAAADQSLVRPEILQAQVKRMLADPKAQRFTEAFAADFSRARFASYEGATDADRRALNESVVATFQDHFWTQQRSVADLFVTTRFLVNPTVAGLLGLPATGTGLQAVDVAALPQRVGLMAHPGVIAGMGDRGTGSFVNRGKYLMERLLCRNPIAVPAEIVTEIEAFNADTTGLNEHERVAIRMMRPTCWGCHAQFEPLAFGFSRFDGAGRYVGEMDTAGKPLPLDGWIPTGGDVEPEYSDVASYMRLLATDPVVQTCLTEHFIAFATARSSDELARLEAGRVGERYLANGS